MLKYQRKRAMREHMVEALVAKSCYIVRAGDSDGLSYVADPFAYSASNLLVGNAPFSASIEIRGEARLRFSEEALISLTGSCEAVLCGVKAPQWVAIPVAEDVELEIRANGNVAYVGITGLDASFVGSRPLREGVRLALRRCYEELSRRRLNALRVPSGILREYQEHLSSFKQGTAALKQSALNLIAKLERHLRLACEAAERGAKLIRVSVGGRTYELWVEEI